jgi:hypothetical protein
LPNIAHNHECLVKTAKQLCASGKKQFEIPALSEELCIVIVWCQQRFYLQVFWLKKPFYPYRIATVFTNEKRAQFFIAFTDSFSCYGACLQKRYTATDRPF